MKGIIILHEIHSCCQPGVDWWEFSLGLSNLTLAAVVGYSAWKIANKDRKVHLADKQQDWLKEFRHNISELMALQITMSTKKMTKMEDGLPDTGEYESRRFRQLAELQLLSNKVLLMFDTKDGYYEQIKYNIDQCDGILSSVNSDTLGRMGLQHLEMRELVDRIIQRQRHKIANLDTKNPLV
jgi:hypothetical protein